MIERAIRKGAGGGDDKSTLEHIVFDHLLAPIAYYLPREEVERWASEAHLEAPLVRWHNQMSWTLIGTRPA